MVENEYNMGLIIEFIGKITIAIQMYMSTETALPISAQKPVKEGEEDIFTSTNFNFVSGNKLFAQAITRPAFLHMHAFKTSVL